MDITISTTASATTLTLPPRRNRPVTRAYGVVITCLSLLIPLVFFYFVKVLAIAIFFHIWHFIGLFTSLSYGLGLAFTGYVTITLDNGTLRAVRRAGPFTSKTVISFHQIARLELDVPDLLRRSILPHNTSLNAELADGGRIPIVQGYPRELLVALADELAARIHITPLDEDAPLPAAAPLPIIDVSHIPLYARDVLAQPLDSKISYVQLDNIHTYSVKRFGQLRSGTEFFFVCLITLAIAAFTSMLTAFFVHEWLQGRVTIFVPFIPLAITLGFLALLLRSIHVFMRRCILIVDDSSITRVTRGPFGKTEIHFPRDTIAQLRTEPASSKSFRIANSSPNLALFLTTTSGRKTLLLTNQEDLDIRWLATQLRHHLNIPL